jgi:sporulation protein YlmC with PRC-barrel domain
LYGKGGSAEAVTGEWFGHARIVGCVLMLSLTDHLGQDVLDAEAGRIGEVADLAFRFDDEYPLVSGLVVAGSRGARRYVPWAFAESFERTAVVLGVPVRQLPVAELADDQLLLGQDVLDTQIFDAVGLRLARVGDVELDREDGLLRIVAVDVGSTVFLLDGEGKLAAAIPPSRLLAGDLTPQGSGA